MSDVVIRAENLYKEYRLGTISHGTLYKDLQSWWARMRGKEDPNSIISTIASSAPGDSKNPHFLALRDVSFEVRRAEALGIIGRNGAGKSTLLKILSEVTSPTKGTVKIKGRVASLLEVGTGFHPELTGRENIYLNGAILGMTRKEIARKLDEIVAFAGIEKFLDTPVKRYSSGMYVRLAFAVAAHLEPEILIVDEVLAVGDAQFQKKCLGKMGEVAKGGRTVLFVSHNMAAIRNLCERAILLDRGEVLLNAKSEEAVSAYLDRNLLKGAKASAEEIGERLEGTFDPGNPFLRFVEIALLDQSGTPRKAFSSDEDITVSVSFECLRKVPELRLFVYVVDENGVHILGSQNLDDPAAMERFTSVGAGTYSATCVLPKNIFGGRTFFLSVHMIYPKVEHVFVNKILEFEVKFKGWSKVHDGVHSLVFLNPQLQWSIQPLAA